MTMETVDTCTGLPLRAAFEEALAKALKAASRDAMASVAVAVLDIDLFGLVNAERGRAAGDAMLRGASDALQKRLSPEAAVYRFGGDAFAVLWPGAAKEQAFLALETFRAEYGSGGAPGVSAGLAAYPDDGAKAGVLVNKACEALYRAKVSGRNQICLAREERMVTKTSHYTQGQLLGLRRLAEREGIKDAELLREALVDLLRKYNA